MKSRREVRREARRLRDGMPEGTRAEASRRICSELLRMPDYPASGKVFSYYPIGSEADVSLFLEQAEKDGKTVALPRVRDDGTMGFYAASADDLSPGSFGLLEPDGTGTELFPEKGDLVLVPCLVFTPEGHRLGYGGGFYDRWLKDHPEGTGVITAFEAQEGLFEPEPHDVPIPRIVTEQGMRRARRRKE